MSWRPGRRRRFWFCRAGSYTSVWFFSSSSDLRYSSSRLKSALDSVWTRLKAQQTSSTPSAPPPTHVTTTTGIPEEKVHRVEGTAPPPPHQTPPTAPQATPPTIQEQECRVTGTATPTTPQAPLFHPGSFSMYLGETYDYLSQHINSYFSTVSQLSSLSVGKAPRGYSSVQGFIGSIITPLVPRLRSASDEAASAAVERREAVRSEDQRASRLLLQREKIVARLSVDNRTRALVQAVRRASDVQLYIHRVEDLSLHLLEFPETRSVAVQERVIPCLLRLRQAGDVSLKASVRKALALLGFTDPVKKRGVRILSIDGGGTRGLLALQTLSRLQQLSGKPVHQLFDYICGVSTGAILGFLLGVFQMPLKDCEDLYKKLSSDVFKQNLIVGAVKMSWSHAFYDSQIWETVLKEKMGSELMIETRRDPDCPKVAAVSTVVSLSPPVKAFVFRNYRLPLGQSSHYHGSCRHRLWEALRASSAAPGYFQEFSLGQHLHQDGGMLVNNPAALAIHECQCLWPDVPLQCVVSLGTGRFRSPRSSSVSSTSLKTKLSHIISSATDTEEVHALLDALLPPDTYFRFNPFLSEEVSLDESRPGKLEQMQAEGLQYLDRNQQKLQRAVRELSRDKSSVQRLTDWLRLRALMNG